MPRQSRRSGVPASRKTPAEPTIIERVMDVEEASLLDVLDHVLTKGVMATGDVTLGVAGIDLIYLRLSALLCAADRVLPGSSSTTSGRKSSRRRAKRRNA